MACWLRSVASGDHCASTDQTGLLDALLAARPEELATRRRAYSREWHNFKGSIDLAEPRGFVGTLRDYQREGLVWFEFLQRFGVWLPGGRHGVGKEGSSPGLT